MEDFANYALDYAISNGADYVEARLQRDDGIAALLKNGNPEVSSLVRNYGMGVRVISHGSLGFASTNILDKKSISDCVSEAMSMARAVDGKLKKNISLSSEDVTKDKWAVHPKVDINSVGIDERFDLLFEIEKTTASSCNDFKMPNRLFIIENEETEKIYLNSEGSFNESKVPRVSFTYILTAFKPGKGTAQRFSQKGESRGWEATRDWNLTDFIANETEMLGRILNEARSPPKADRLDVLLGSEVVGIVCHESCGHPFEADRIMGREAAEAGESFITREMLGQKIGSEAVTIVDDPTLPHSYGFYLYDDEGVKARRRELIKNGIINEFFHNRETAADLGLKGNGSARSEAYNKEPIIRMANTFMDTGDYGFEELLEGISYGIYMKNFMEWNIDDKRYNQRYVGLEAYEVINGEFKRLVRNPTLEVTTPTLYSSIDAVGKDLSFNAATCGKGDPQQGVPVWTGGPTVRVRKIRLGGLP